MESTVWINEAHPAYRRAATSRSEGYHIALASALALATLAVEPAKEHAFVTAFLASWGSAIAMPATPFDGVVPAELVAMSGPDHLLKSPHKSGPCGAEL